MLVETVAVTHTQSVAFVLTRTILWRTTFTTPHSWPQKHKKHIIISIFIIFTCLGMLEPWLRQCELCTEIHASSGVHSLCLCQEEAKKKFHHRRFMVQQLSHCHSTTAILHFSSGGKTTHADKTEHVLYYLPWINMCLSKPKWMPRIHLSLANQWLKMWWDGGDFD